MLAVTQKKFAAGLSICSNAVIILLKLIAGILSGSISIISEAVHSLSDFLASVLTFFAVMKSSEPADSKHPFGHGRYEDMSGFIEGGLIIFAALYIFYEAGKKLIFGYTMENESFLGIAVMGFAVLANFFVSSYLFYVAKKTNSISLYADAEHLRTDIWSSLGVLIGLILLLGGLVAFFLFALMDKKLDRQLAEAAHSFGETDPSEKFSFRDVKNILVNPGFWLIALLCVLFYSCVFPFQKFASEFMILKYGIDENIAGTFAVTGTYSILFFHIRAIATDACIGKPSEQLSLFVM